MADSSRPIAVVDDDPDLREAICEILADEGYDARVFDGGPPALEFLRRGGRPGLILLDLTMPGMSGWEFRTRQLGDALLRDIPVVVLTASRNLAGRPIAAQEVLYKPIDADELIAAVARNVGTAEGFRGPRAGSVR